MTLIDFTCPKCGAALKIENGASQVSCEYCGSSFIVDGASAAAPAPTPSPAAAPQPTGKKTPCGGYSADIHFPRSAYDTHPQKQDAQARLKGPYNRTCMDSLHSHRRERRRGGKEHGRRRKGVRRNEGAFRSLRRGKHSRHRILPLKPCTAGLFHEEIPP